MNGKMRFFRYTTFACPGCGGEFRPEWYKLVFILVRIGNKTLIKCPICKKRGMCRGLK